MELTRLKYSKNSNIDFIEYIGLGYLPLGQQEGIAFYFPNNDTKKAWNDFFVENNFSKLFYTFLDFWWNWKENGIEPTSLPDEYLINFKNSFSEIDNIVSKYLEFSELPPPAFKYLDFIEGKETLLEIVDEEEQNKEFSLITFDSDERILINLQDHLEQLFVPEIVFTEFKKDLETMIKMIVKD